MMESRSRVISKSLLASFWCCLVTFVLICIIIPIAVRHQLSLKEGSLPLASYIEPPLVTHIAIRIFNITNMDQYDSSDENFVPQFEEVGPIVYDMTRKRVNVSFKDQFITSQIVDTYKYNENLSKLKEDDYVNTVNLKNYVASMMQNRKPLIQSISINHLLWDKDVGLLKDANGVVQKPVTINSGSLNQFSTYKILDIDGKIRGPYLDGCNRFDGSFEGVGFSPLPYNMKIYFEPFGRNFELKWTKYRYGKADYIFSKDSFNMKLKKNKCYDQAIKYDGAMQLSDINSNMNPAMISFPHFLHSKDDRLTSIIGMNPNTKQHESFFRIEPMSGLPLALAIRFQINILPNKGNLIPVIWTDIAFKLDEDTSNKLRFVHFLLLVLPLFVSICFICVSIVYFYHIYHINRRKKVGYIMMD